MTESTHASLHELLEHGQSYWLDNLSRRMIRDGELERRVGQEGLRGVTSNPAIFRSAISGGDAYDEQIEHLVRSGRSLMETYEELACSDLQDACDILRPVYDESAGRDGYVSLEVSPHLIHDTEGSLEEARRLWARVDRPNLYIKIPGTPAGAPAVEQLIYEGISVNVTLLFSLSAYEEVARAYIRGLRRRLDEGEPVDGVTSVASFFLSRIDVLVDELLGHRIGISDTSDGASFGPRAEDLLGQAAIASAKLAYASFERLFSGPEWEPLAAAGAGVQRLLWASTSTKNPTYNDVMYVEPLIGPETVNTMPESTIAAFADHGAVRPGSIRDGAEQASRTLADLEDLGIDLKSVHQRLIDEGAKKFIVPFDALLDGLARKRFDVLGDDIASEEYELGDMSGSVDSTLSAMSAARFVRRLFAGDTSLWTRSDETARLIRERLGWLDLSVLQETMDAARTLADSLGQENVGHAVILGMGGSSLTAAVAARVFGRAPDAPELHVLDDTSPEAITDLESRIELERTVFLVASKSGTTLETLSLYRYFYSRVEQAGVESPGNRFIGLTDAGTLLEIEARQKSFRQTFETPEAVGGRFSALTSFGLVPMALLGADLDAVCYHAQAMLTSCGPDGSANLSPGVKLGAALAYLSDRGYRHVTLLASESLAAFPLWIEQLLAESTGKGGQGLIPVVSDPALDMRRPKSGRVIVTTELAGDRSVQARLEALSSAGCPVIRLIIPSLEAIGGEFIRWQIATATAGALLGINPFDEPDVRASQENTRRLLETISEGKLPDEPAATRQGGLSGYLRSDAPWSSSLSNGTLDALLSDFLSLARPENYVGILAYFPPTAERLAALDRLRRAIARLGPVTTLAQGPRYLHSTGQLHKGGPDTGVFLMLTADPSARIPVPGAEYGFGELHRAQALGDYEALLEADRPILRINLGWYITEALDRLAATIG
ncbi:MAG: bifunctional transaldolase/phosoglucose isomerase [Gemmatimonadota bacterium]